MQKIYAKEINYAPAHGELELYLAREVDSAMILKDAIISELKQSIATLSRSNTRLRQKLDRLSS